MYENRKRISIGRESCRKRQNLLEYLKRELRGAKAARHFVRETAFQPWDFYWEPGEKGRKWTTGKHCHRKHCWKVGVEKIIYLFSQP